LFSNYFIAFFFPLLTMMRFSVASLTLVSAEQSWKEWKFEYGVAYNGDEEDAVRQQVYETNVQKINDHNAKGKTWTMAMNSFGDRTHDEFIEIVSSPNRTMIEDEHGILDESLPEASIPGSIDWVERGAFNPIRSQQDSDCWAHSAIGVLESNWKIATNNMVQLTEQQLCDCSDQGTCSGGGDEDGALEWFENHPACSRQSYAYTGRDARCKESSCNAAIPKGAVTGTTYVNKDASSLKSALAGRPVTASVHSDDLSQFYSSGVIGDPGCGGSVDHAVIAVGYGSENGESYFKIRNSWGKSWGEHGYARLGQSGGSLGNACLFRWQGSYPNLNGGVAPSPSPSPSPQPSPSPSPSPSGGCSNFNGWTNQDGDTCRTYHNYDYCTSSGGTGSGWQTRWGRISDFYDNQGNTAIDACCTCGGGHRGQVVV